MRSPASHRVARLLLCAVAASLVLASVPAAALYRYEDLPPRLRQLVFDAVQTCNRVGGRPGAISPAIEGFDFDRDGTPDLIFDEARLPCAGVQPETACGETGCVTYVFLSDRGRWRLALDVVGSYCVDRRSDPPTLVTIQRNYLTSGGSTELNVRYRFAKGMAFQEGQGRC